MPELPKHNVGDPGGSAALRYDETGAQLAHFSGKMIKDTEEEQKTMAKAHRARQWEYKQDSFAQRLRQWTQPNAAGSPGELVKLQEGDKFFDTETGCADESAERSGC